MEGMGGQVEGGRSPLYHEATVLPKERPEALGPWRGRLGVRRPGKISEMEERGEGRAAQDKEMLSKGPGGRLWDRAMDEAGRQESALDRYAGSDRSQGGGHAGTHGPHAPRGKHGGPRRLEHEGLGVPVLLNMGARQIPGRQAGQCASCVVLPPQNHQALALGGEGLACP